MSNKQRDDYLIKKVGEKWGVYEDATDYSPIFDGTLKAGAAVLGDDGRPALFDTPREAAAWLDSKENWRWESS